MTRTIRKAYTRHYPTNFDAADWAAVNRLLAERGEQPSTMREMAACAGSHREMAEFIEKRRNPAVDRISYEQQGRAA